LEVSRNRIAEKGCSKEFSALEAAVKEKSAVVVSMPAGMARRLFDDPKSLYTNYERLLGANARKPAESNNDRHRCAVAALLFGSYADRIVYGVLSLTEEGLPTYGDVYCTLRSITIDNRVSFLETNSYRFVKDHGISAGDKLPLGHMACWKRRHILALAKLADRLTAAQTESDWQAILVHSDGQNRESDDFVEAHIYEGFDWRAVESMAAVPDKKLTREIGLDLEIALSKFKGLQEEVK